MRRISLPRQGLTFFALAATTLLLDLVSKVWASRALVAGPRTVVPGRLNFVLAHNPHGAMGLLHTAPDHLRRIVLVATTVIASIAIVAWARKAQGIARVGLALVLGGALGNLIDRVSNGAVVDFIDVVLYGGKHWHTFNIADVAIVLGIALAAAELGRPRATA
ncbi:MAG: signal peptidase II [Polyangiales bacterium]